MNLLQPCSPAMPGPRAEMREEEAQTLDILLHLVKPELVVECGTLRGGSACIFARHAEVVTFDPAPQVEGNAFGGKPITQIIGSAPHELNKLERFVLATGIGFRRWMFFHDSVHKAQFLIDELTWAFANGAFCAAWHDVALDDMLDAIPRLNQMGHVAFRVQDFGKEQASWSDPPPTIWQGIGFCWNGKW